MWHACKRKATRPKWSDYLIICFVLYSLVNSYLCRQWRVTYISMCIKGRKQTCVVFILDMQNITMRNAFLDFFCLKYNLELCELCCLLYVYMYLRYQNPKYENGFWHWSPWNGVRDSQWTLMMNIYVLFNDDFYISYFIAL